MLNLHQTSKMTQYKVYSLHCHPFTCLFFYRALCVKPTLYIIIDMRIVSSRTPLYSVDSLSLVLHSWHLAQYVNIGPPWSNLSAKIYTTQYDRKKFAERGTLLQNIATKGVYLP